MISIPILAAIITTYEMESQNYGRKGSCFLQFLLLVIILVICLIWVYYKNFRLTF